jgi:hypothetical protein
MSKQVGRKGAEGVKVTVEHGLTQDEAARRVRSWLEEMMDDVGHEAEEVGVDWAEHRAEFAVRAQGMRFSGSLRVTAATVLVEGKLPLMARPFRSRIEGYIRGGLRSALAG